MLQIWNLNLIIFELFNLSIGGNFFKLTHLSLVNITKFRTYLFGKIVSLLVVPTIISGVLFVEKNPVEPFTEAF